MLSAAALAAAAGLAAYPAFSLAGMERLVGLAGAFGAVVLLAGLALGSPSPVPWAVTALGGEYAAWFALDRVDVDMRAPLYGAGLLLVAELSYWAFDRTRGVRVEPTLELRRAAALLGLLAASIALGALLLGTSAISLGSSVAVEALGIAGAVVLLVLVARLARSEPRDGPQEEVTLS